MIIAIADVHVRTDDYRIIEDRLAIIKDRFPGAWLVVCGDITDDGTFEQYKAAERLLGPFAGRLTLVPGNHDYGKMGLGFQSTAVRGFQHLSKDLSSYFSASLHGYRIIGVDSCSASRSPLDFAQGELGEAELYRMECEIKAAHTRGVSTVIAMHHDPVRDKWFERLRDAQRFMDKTYGIVDHVVFGHTHGPGHIWTCPRGKPTKLICLGSFRYDTEGIIAKIEDNEVELISLED